MTSGRPAESAAALCQRWVSFYTRRLDEESRHRRRAEIESDLYEHAAEAAAAGVTSQRLAAEILGRVLVGVPADLSWRREIRQPRKRLALRGTAMSLSPHTANRAINILCGVVVVFVWGAAFSGVVYIGLTEGYSADPRWLFLIVPFVASLVMIAGLRVRSTDPRRGLHLISVGLLGPCVWFWFLPFYGPLAIAIAVITVANTPRKNQPTVTAA